MADNNSKTSLGTEETGGEEERMVERALVPKGEQQDAAVDQEIVSPQAGELNMNLHAVLHLLTSS